MVGNLPGQKAWRVSLTLNVQHFSYSDYRWIELRIWVFIISQVQWELKFLLILHSSKFALSRIIAAFKIQLDES